MEAVLYGRQETMNALRGALDAAFGGRGCLALVSGEPGIGKTAVVTAIAHEAEARGAAVTWGRAWEFAGAPAYFPVWPCFRAMNVGVFDDPKASHDERDAFRLWERVASTLARVSSTTPTVWILEDLHASDLGTLDLLTFLAQSVRAMRVLLVATARTTDPRITDRMARRLTRIARDGLEVGLQPLTSEEVAAVARDALGQAVPAGAVRRLVELTGGNPLFVVECARAFRAAGGVEGTIGALPASVRQVVLDRVSDLPESTRAALRAGAVLGREFSAATVARMIQALPARVIDSLLPAMRAGLLRETRPGHFTFSHALTRDAIDDGLGGDERAHLHDQASAALATLEETAEVIVERARHALAGLHAIDDGRALLLAGRATDLLEREGAFDRALDLHTRMEEARRAGLLPPLSGAARLHVARIARAAGRSDTSRRLCEEVVAAARAASDAELFAKAALLHAADVRPGVIDRSQVALLEEARALLGERSPKLDCVVLARLATALQPAPDPAVPAAMTREALRKARESADEGTILEVLELAGWGLYWAPLAERTALSNELLERALRAGDLPKALDAYAWLAFCYACARDFGAFERVVWAMLALSDEVGHPRRRWPALLLASGLTTVLGRFADSDRYVTEVTQLVSLIDDPAIALSLAFHDIMRGRLQRRDDDVRAALGKLESVTEGMPAASVFCAVIRATCYARMEDAAATRAELAKITGRAGPVEAQFISAAQIAEAYAMAGSDDDRRRIRAVLADAEDSEVVGGQMSFTYDGPVVRLLGLLDASLGNLELAEHELREAVALAKQREHLPLVAQASYELANVMRRAGRAGEARALFEECRAIARDLGMAGLEGRVATSDAVPARSSPLRMEKRHGLFYVEQGGRAVTVKDSRGLQLLARLVERPNEEIHVLALASDDPGASLPESSAGEAIDETARKAYRARLSELEEELAEAERRGDTGRVSKLQRERESLASELARAVGLGGRARQAGSATERARVNAQRRLKDAIARVTEVDAELGRFLARGVRTGTFCCFRHAG